MIHLLLSLVLSTTLISQDFLMGGDLSFVPQIEAAGGVYMDEGVPGDPIEILADHGLNSVRLRLWHTPDEEWCNLENTLAMAQRAKDLELHLLLNIHYSDWWADPGHQDPPAAWDNIYFEDLVDSVYNYTHAVISALRDQGTLPDMVQVGNEINCGMLWPWGYVCGDSNTPEQWSRFTQLLSAGVDAVRDAAGEDSVTIMIHHAGGSQGYYQNLLDNGLEFNVIGLSFYSRWHGSFTNLSTMMGNLAYVFDKPVVVVETAYPWTLDWYDSQTNIWGSEEHLHAGFPATVAGQQAFLEELVNRIENVYNGLGMGFHYWAPTWISAPEEPSAWENVTLFDFEGDLLQSVAAYGIGLSVEAVNAREGPHFEVFPNPTNAAINIRFEGLIPAGSTLELFDLRGKLLERIRLPENTPQTIRWSLLKRNTQSFPAGVYILRLYTGEVRQSIKLLMVN